ncbi:MAG: hemerythrin domain-containing protein [Dehalococcoidia bacterium]|nr:hemerythrin domain-containing protein [Dehalococcoidia bacterium]
MDRQDNSRARQVSQITQDMHDLHQDAWDKLDNLERHARLLTGRKGAESRDALKNIADTISFMESAVRSHFKIEEEQVYSFLKDVLPPNRRRSVTAMEKDHLKIGALVGEIKGFLKEARNAKTSSAAADSQTPDACLRMACLRLVRIMRKHITKENLIYQELGETP